MPEEQQLPMVMDGDTDIDVPSTVEMIEAQWAQDKEIIRVMLKTSAPFHWETFGDNVRLNRRGAEHFARFLGMSVKCGVPVQYDYERGHFGYIVPVTVLWRGREETYNGMCDSYDKFIGTNYDAPFTEADHKSGRCRQEQIGQPRKLPFQVNRGNIMRKAQANGIANAVGRLLSISAIPADMFSKLVSFETSQVKFGGK